MTKKKIIIAVLICCFFIVLLFVGFVLWQKSQILKTLKLSNSNNLKASSLPVATPSLTKMTLESIFAPDHSRINKLPKEKVFTIITTGDVIPGRTVNYKMTTLNNFKYPFEKTAELLKTADLTLINLESPLIKDCPVTNEGMVFCGDQRFIEGLKFADIDVVNIANNHALNYEVEGLQQTIDLLESNNILTSGYPINNLTIKQFNNLQIGFLGWNLLEKFEEENIINTIRNAKQEVNLLIVSLHWGAEYQALPTKWQQTLAHNLIDAGADLIVGNHSHWIQPLEIYKDKLIIYAHGNFVFDQEWSRETKIGFLAKHTFYDNKLVDTEIFPVLISNFSQPDFLLNQDKEQIINLIKQRSLELIKAK